ncbi:MAG: succinate dehydrogenase/fumarate reductase iron-sulfur subunit [Candidatus Kapaibacteriales bacterium]
MKVTLHIWRQKDQFTKGSFETYHLDNVLEDMSFLEMLDVLNEKLIQEGKEPVAFDHDCREGICGSCSLTINGIPHGPEKNTTTCQLHMRKFNDGDEIWIEPFRARAFPVIKDLIVDRSALDRIIQAGGFISVNTGQAPEANSILIPKQNAENAMDAAQCIGCGACVAACPNGAAMLFVAAKVSHFAYLPQGQPERKRRVLAMVEQMQKEGFGNCSNHYECEEVCPKGISVRFIALMNRDYLKANFSEAKLELAQQK